MWVNSPGSSVQLSATKSCLLETLTKFVNMLLKTMEFFVYELNIDDIESVSFCTFK